MAVLLYHGSVALWLYYRSVALWLTEVLTEVNTQNTFFVSSWGNWDAKIQESRFSSKLPIKTSEVSRAGFHVQEKKHQNPS